MAKRKKKHQKERVLEPLVRPGEPIKTPVKAPANATAKWPGSGQSSLPAMDLGRGRSAASAWQPWPPFMGAL